MTKHSPITAKTWRWAGGWSLAIILFSCLPYLIAALAAPEGWQFAGILVNPFDGQSYLAKMRQGFEGNWLFHLTYTPEPHRGAFIFTFYIALGHLAASTHLPLIVVFHLARVIAGFGLLLVAFRFIAKVTSDPNEQRLAFVLLLTSSGFGWLGVIVGAFPIDLWIPEAFTPYSLYATPHFLVGMALMLLLLQRAAWPPSPASMPSGFPAPLLTTGLIALALALILPFALLTIWAVLGVYLGWLYFNDRRLPWLPIWHTLAVGLFSGPVIFYDYWVSTTNLILAGWSVQNVTPAPNILDFVLGYGLVGLLAILGGWIIMHHSKQKLERGEWVVLLWAVTTIILVYLPFDLQRRFINGLHIPLCILAAIGLQRWLAQSRFRLGRRRQVTAVVVAVGVLGTLFVWSLLLIGALQSVYGSPTPASFFVRQEEVATLNWLRENIRADAVILSSPHLGIFVPGQTGARVFYGHPFETVDADEKKKQVEAFYRGEIESVAPPVDFIIYGPAERALGEPKGLANYPVVFETETITIYQVTK